MARRFTGDSLVVATHNPGKVGEIAELLARFGIAVRSAAELALPEPEETGESFAANAELKARSAALHAGAIALADDSGLAVEALGGAPGIRSARWAGRARDFAVAMARVQSELEALGAEWPEARGAHFVAALTLAWPDGHCETFEGRVEGTIVWPPRGENGFGYDPIFRPEGHSITFAEMTPAAKHAINHRAIAFARLSDACFRPRR